MKINELSKLVVIKGPGPFTAIRVGVTVANTLSLAIEVPLYGIKKTKSFNYKNIINQVINSRVNADKFIKPCYGQEPNITKPKNKN